MRGTSGAESGRWYAGAAVSVPAYGTTEAGVPCPSGAFPTGGGGRGSDGVFLIGSSPDSTTSPNRWTVRGHNRYSVPGTLTAFVVCTSSGSHIGGTIGGSVQPGSEGATRDRCGSPTVATGVGWRSATGMYISAAGVFGNRTAVEANNEDTVSHDLFLTQMCAEGAHSQHTGSRVVLQQYQTATATVSCPAGEVPTGGGASRGTGAIWSRRRGPPTAAAGKCAPPTRRPTPALCSPRSSARGRDDPAAVQDFMTKRRARPEAVVQCVTRT